MNLTCCCPWPLCCWTWLEHLQQCAPVYSKTRNTLDCDQSNVYSSRVIFSSISPGLPFRSFSLYDRSANDPPLQNKFRISVIRVNSHYKLESEDKVGSVYIHEVNGKMRFRDLAI